MPHAITTQMIAANGLTFEVDVCAPEAPGPPKFALLLHGFPECNFAWRYQLPWLAARGYTAWAPNLRGYGRSSRPAGRAAYAISALLDDIAGLMDAGQLATGGAAKTLLIGHDWGAALAWCFAASQQRPLSGLVAMNVPHPAVFRDTFWQRGQFLRSWYILFFQLPWLPEALLAAGGARAVGNAFRASAIDKSRFPPQVCDVYRRNALLPGALTAMINYYRAQAGELDCYMRPHVRPIDVPTLLLWGAADRFLSLPNAVDYRDLVRDFTLQVLPGVSHWVQQEAPEAVNAALGAWLAG